MSKATQQLMTGAGVLALSGFVAKILSAVYRVPFQNIVGNTGFYVYQQIYPLYGIGMVLALSGWPLFISKIITEQPDEAHRQLVARRIFWSLLVIGAGIFGLLYFGANSWALLLGGDMRLAPVVRAVSWMFWLMPFLAVSRGVAQGKLNMVPTAISQVIEQVVRVSVILGAAFWAVQHDWSVYRMGAWTTFSATIAGAAAMIYLAWPLAQNWRLRIPEIVRHDQTLGWRHIWRRLMTEGGLLAMLAALLVLLQLVDSMSVKVLLQDGGMAVHLAEATKGVYDRGQPMVQLGMVVATGLGTTLLPALRAHFVMHDDESFKRDFQLTLRLSLVLAAVASAGLIAIMPVVNDMLFGSREGSVALAWYTASILPATLIVVLTSTLQSTDRARGIGWMILVTMVFKYVLNEWLVPHYGIVGASVATVVALLPMLGVTILRLPKFAWRGWASWSWFGRLLLVIGLVMIVAFGIRAAWDALFGLSRAASVLATALSVAGGVVTFILGISKLDVLSSAEWQALPKGDKLYKRLKRGM
jgi:PST family polysaccharide transporter